MLQVITEYKDAEIEQVLEATERLDAHLTAAVVSNDVLFLGKVNHTLSHLTLPQLLLTRGITVLQACPFL